MRPLTLLVVSLASSAAVTACDDAATPPTPVMPDRPAAAAAAAPTPTPVPVPADGRVVIAQVTWPPDSDIDRAALSAMPESQARLAGTSPVPLLVPSRPDLLAAPVIVVKEHWASFWARTPQITVSLMATRLARVYDAIPPARGPSSVRGLPAFITRNEGIWSATWMENGASYALDLECVSPDAPLCATDALLLELASTLVYVGGAGARAPGGAP